MEWTSTVENFVERPGRDTINVREMYIHTERRILPNRTKTKLRRLAARIKAFESSKKPGTRKPGSNKK